MDNGCRLALHPCITNCPGTHPTPGVPLGRNIIYWTCQSPILFFARRNHIPPDYYLTGTFCAHMTSKEGSNLTHHTHESAHRYLLCKFLASIHEPHNKRSHRQNSVPKLPSSATKVSCPTNSVGSNRALSNNNHRPPRQQGQQSRGASVVAQPGSKLSQYKFQDCKHSLVYRSNLLLLATAVSKLQSSVCFQNFHQRVLYEVVVSG